MAMNQAQPAINELRIVVCGSSSFQDQDNAFALFDSVQRMLETISRGTMRVGTVVSGEFDGIDQLAKVWAEQRGIGHEPMRWATSQHVSHSFFDREMPATVMMNHPAFKECAECLKKAHVDAMALFPNKDGKLGSTARNMKVVADYLEIDTFSADEVFGAIQKNMDNRATDIQAQQAALVEQSARQTAKARPRF